MLMRISTPLASIAVAALAGCTTTEFVQQDALQIETTPSGARAGLENGDWCMTPCALAIASDEALIELSGVGFETVNVLVVRARDGRFAPEIVNVEMNLVHKTSAPVDAAPLATPEDG